MTTLGVWWSLVILSLWHAVMGAHIPPNTSDENSDGAYDINTNGETENNRLELLQELLELSIKSEDSANAMKTEIERVSVPKGIPAAGQDRRGKVGAKVRGKVTPTTTTTTTTQAPTTAVKTKVPGGEEPGKADTSLYEYTKQELINLFYGGLRGNGSVAAGCPIPHLSLKARCSANVMEVTVSSRINLLGRLTMEGGDGWVDIKGAHIVVFAVVNTAGTRGRFTTRLLKTDVNLDCDYCGHLTALLYLKVGEVKCILVVECAPTPIMQEMLHNTPTPVYFPTTPAAPIISTTEDPTITAKTTMRLLESSSGLDGLEVIGPVPLGTKLNLVVSAYSLQPLDLHLVKCEARDEEGRAVVLLKDGCSVSQVLEDFREVVEVAGQPQLRRVSQYAKLRVFNTRAAPQNITLLCAIKVCSGECSEHPTCVVSDINLGRSKRPVASLYSRQVTLAKTFRVAGFPVSRPASPSAASFKPEDGKAECDCSHVTAREASGGTRGCLSYQMVYLVLGISTALYLLITLCAYYLLRRPTSSALGKSHVEDTESPPRAFYAEYSSPRRRTPQASPEYSTLTMTQDARRSPHY